MFAIKRAKPCLIWKKEDRFMTEKEKIKVILKALDDKKAKDIKVIKVADLTTLTDCFVIASASNTTQAKALSDEVEFKMKEAGEKLLGQEGYTSAGWILLDFGNIVVNVFHEKEREFYSLERLWQDGAEIDIKEFLEGEE